MKTLADVKRAMVSGKLWFATARGLCYSVRDGG